MKKIGVLLQLFLLATMTVFYSCKSANENNPAAPPSSKFTGNWKSEIPVEVIIQTDFCTNTLEDVAVMEWDVRWVVKETADPNVMDITMTYSSSNYTVTNPACDGNTGYLPEPQPLYLKGYVTNNKLIVTYLNEEIINVDYVNNKMVGELSYSYCFLYCQKLYTEEDNFSIVEF